MRGRHPGIVAIAPRRLADGPGGEAVIADALAELLLQLHLVAVGAPPPRIDMAPGCSSARRASIARALLADTTSRPRQLGSGAPAVASSEGAGPAARKAAGGGPAAGFAARPAGTGGGASTAGRAHFGDVRMEHRHQHIAVGHLQRALLAFHAELQRAAQHRAGFLQARKVREGRVDPGRGFVVGLGLHAREERRRGPEFSDRLEVHHLLDIQVGDGQAALARLRDCSRKAWPGAKRTAPAAAGWPRNSAAGRLEELARPSSSSVFIST